MRTRTWLGGCAVALAMCGVARADFVELTTSINIHPVNRSAAAWGDFDNDGDLDLVVCGHDGLKGVTKIYRNAEGRFSDVSADVIGVHKGAVAWGDFDGDGDLDLAICGDTNERDNRRITRIYRNDNGKFANLGADLTGVVDACLSWVDFDNDGDLDLFVAGRTLEGENITHIYRNTGGKFARAPLGPSLDAAAVRDTKVDPGRLREPAALPSKLAPIPVALPGIASGSADWADFDKDGDLDLLLTGSIGTGRIAQVYRNEGGQFSKVNVNLPGIFQGSALWIDYDNDGDADILLVGAIQANAAVRKLYRNDNGNFTELEPNLPQHFSQAQISQGDFDNDGDPDLLMWGAHMTAAFSGILQNGGAGNFSVAAANFPGPNYGASLLLGSFTCADVDKDGDLDVLLTGSIPPQHNNMSRIFVNNLNQSNAAPTAPTGLAVQVNGDEATFTWSAASDDHTPAAALTYNLRVSGPQPMPAMSRRNGYRQVVAAGNCSHSTRWKLKQLPPGRYTWSVQAVDGGFMGGPFATGPRGEELSFTISSTVTLQPPPADPRNIPKDKQEEGRPSLPPQLPDRAPAPPRPGPTPGPRPGPGPDPRSP